MLKDEVGMLEAKLHDMNWASRNLPSGASLEKEIAKGRAACTSTMESEREIMSEFHLLIDSAQSTRKALAAPASSKTASPTLVYWKDEAGEHSFVTDINLLSS